jgi:hypothetical protein
LEFWLRGVLLKSRNSYCVADTVTDLLWRALFTKVTAPDPPPTTAVSPDTAISSPRKWAGSQINISPVGYRKKPEASNVGHANTSGNVTGLLQEVIVGKMGLEGQIVRKDT